MPFDLKFSHKNPIGVWDSVITLLSLLLSYLAAACIGLVMGVASCYACGGGGGGGGGGA